MTFDEAMTLLGLDRAERDLTVVRTAYLNAIRATHPDLHRRSGATAETALVVGAYEIVVATIDAEGPTVPGPRRSRASGPSTPRPPTTDRRPPTDRRVIEVDVTVIADDTIEVAAPPDLAFAWLVQTGHVVGDVTFLDRSAALLQILVSFVDEPVCQMIFDLQGRAARGTTEIFCTIDSIEDRDAPPIAAVTQFIADHLVEVIGSGE